MSKKICFVIGHHARSRGGFSRFLNKREFDFWKQYEDELQTIGDVFYHNPWIVGYNSRQKAMAKRTANYDVVFELHFNLAAVNAQGCEAWYYASNKKTKRMSEKFCNAYSSLSPAVNRGAKGLYNAKQRGFGFVYYQKPNAILLEPFFGDHEKDCAAFSITNFLKAIRHAIH